MIFLQLFTDFGRFEYLSCGLEISTILGNIPFILGESAAIKVSFYSIKTNSKNLLLTLYLKISSMNHGNWHIATS